MDSSADNPTTPQSIVCLSDKTRTIVTESYKLTFVYSNLGIYGERLLLRITEYAQSEISKFSIADGKDLRKIDIAKETTLEGVILKMSIWSIVGNTHRVTENTLKSIESLVGVYLTYVDKESGRTTVPFLSKCNIKSNIITIAVTNDVWKLLMDFSAGYRTYMLKEALKLRSPYALKLYKMLSGQTLPLRFPLEKFVEQFGLKKKYHTASDLLRYVIIPAQKELDKKMPYTFEVEKEWKTIPGRKPEINGFIFKPKYQAENDTINQPPISGPKEKILPPLTDGQINAYLQMGVDQDSLKNNDKLFRAANAYLDMRPLIIHIVEKINSGKIEKPAGFIVKQLQKELKKKNVI